MSFITLLNTKDDVLKNVDNQTADVAYSVKSYYGSQWSILWTSTVWVEITILQNIIVCVQQKKEIHTGLKQLKSE